MDIEAFISPSKRCCIVLVLQLELFKLHGEKRTEEQEHPSSLEEEDPFEQVDRHLQ
jgi:hypothetical protein